MSSQHPPHDFVGTGTIRTMVLGFLRRTEPLHRLRRPPSPATAGEDELRIIAGEWRGRPIEAPPGMGTRPTADRLRETLFSMLLSRLGSFEGLRVADLFAGSGALGLEALSRGAASATFVDSDANAIQAIRRNLQSLGVADRATVIPGSALSLRAGQAYDLIFADPPYSPGSGSAVVEAVAQAEWLAPGGWISVETARGDAVAARRYVIDTVRDSGRARLTLLRHS